MKSLKIAIALALYLSSASFSDQVIGTQSGLVSNWELQIGLNTSHSLVENIDNVRFE